MLFGEEPGKQKTPRPERRGNTRAVSPKKIGERKKGGVGQRGLKSVTAAPCKLPNGLEHGLRRLLPGGRRSNHKRASAVLRNLAGDVIHPSPCLPLVTLGEYALHS
jgi:hypothetical protein